MYRIFFKRLLDLLISFFLLPLLLILIALVGLIIKLEDKGPIFYVDSRIGKNMKLFKMIKFRSMKIDSIDVRNPDGSTFNSAYDSRQTKIGRIIRKLSIDEFPQIINVLKGEMSFIGPRPSPIGNLDKYSDEYMKKFAIRPGITGYTQAYYRNSIGMLEKQKYDIFYYENLSLLLDIKILFKTVATILKRRGINTNN